MYIVCGAHDTSLVCLLGQCFPEGASEYPSTSITDFCQERLQADCGCKKYLFTVCNPLVGTTLRQP